MKKILLLGPAHPLRGGGITTFNHRLANEFQSKGHQCEIVSFSLQYPSFLFPGKSQYSSEPPPDGLTIHPLLNSINPLSWFSVGRKISGWRPDLIIVRFWLPLMGPALGTVLRIVKRNKYTKVICIADNVVPHEKRPGDKLFTRYFLRACDAFVTMSEKVAGDLRRFEPGKPALQLPHPLYDNFGEKVSKAVARQRLNLSADNKILLFFGFIRRYKGLDLLLQAMTDRRIQQQGIKLIVAGEFYGDSAPYLKIIEENNLQDSVVLHTRFIADNEVKNFLCAADCVIQPYRNATQSGVTPLAYHFEVPMIVTNVGGLPSLVPDGKVGLVTEPSPAAIADTIIHYFELGEAHFLPALLEEKQKYSWKKFTDGLLQLADAISPATS